MNEILSAPAGPPPLALRSRRVVTPEGERAATVRIEGGRVTAIEPWEAGSDATDLGSHALLPGLVDTHVHIDDPGRADWEGFACATAAAAAGGVTTLVDMPLNSVPATTDVAALEVKRAAAAGRCRVDVGFWGGLVPGNLDQLVRLHRAGVLGFKAFLAPSGVDEFPAVALADLRAAAPLLAELGAPLLVHAELAEELAELCAAFAAAPAASRRSYASYLASRPPVAELAAIEALIELARAYRLRVHVVHLATAAALPALAAARAEGLPVTVETCPHYLAFAADEIPDGATAFKCAPPIRGGADRDGLWEGLRAGTIDLVASDHSPCPPELKAAEAGDFAAAWGGIPSLQIGLPALWTMARARGASLADLARWTAAAPARLAGLAERKGAIAVGGDADLVAFDPDVDWTHAAEQLLTRHRVGPWIGRRFGGRVEATWLGGHLVSADGAPVGPPRGKMLTR